MIIVLAPPRVLPQFSVCFPSGIRRASLLTPSLELRLGPRQPPPLPGERREDGDIVTRDGSGASDSNGSGVIRLACENSSWLV